jgi:hypothetical protein
MRILVAGTLNYTQLAFCRSLTRLCSRDTHSIRLIHLVAVGSTLALDPASVHSQEGTKIATK